MAKPSPSFRSQLIVALGTLMLIAPSSVHGQDTAGQAVAKLESAWAAAEVKHDAATIGKLLSDDFTFVLPDGAMATKAQLLKQIAADTTSVLSGGNTEYQPRVYGNTVVITGLFTATVKTKTGTELRRYRWTDTWIKGSDGQWKCVAAQSMLLPAK